MNIEPDQFVLTALFFLRDRKTIQARFQRNFFDETDLSLLLRKKCCLKNPQLSANNSNAPKKYTHLYSVYFALPSKGILLDS